jgi:hypothetical protein
VVWGVNIQYYITDTDLSASQLTNDFEQNRPKLRYYRAACAEPRFFRHRRRLQWSPRDAWPAHLGIVHRETLYFRHYPYRSARQIQMRLDVRRENRARGFEGWEHASELTWQEKIVPSAGLHRDEGDGRLIVEEEVLRQPFEPHRRRLIKRLLHSTGVWP